MDTSIFTNYLKLIFGNKASFRKDQLEAIISTVNNHFTLVVEKTGWGKSLVYFLATKYFRDNGYGPTIIVSPLKSLMRNQIEAASKLNLRAEMISGEFFKRENENKKYEILTSLNNNKIDILYVTPEQLNKNDLYNLLIANITQELALFVIDEVHCVSEWGHDFRPDFCSLKYFVESSIVNNKKIHILATTATANDMVIEDLCNQFNCEITTIRGELCRDSLHLCVLPEMSLSHKYAWILEYLQNHSGSGIIYALTIKDCDLLAQFLSVNNIVSFSYHSENGDEKNRWIEEKFFNNEIKVLVATSALGMGYDKPDVAFVIHLQKAKSMLEYYQQIGRAGRDIAKADVILMRSPKDDNCLGFFIKNAFPEPKIMREILSFIETQNIVKRQNILECFNISVSSCDKILKHLLARKLIRKDGSNYLRTFEPDNLDSYIKEKSYINNIKEKDLRVMEEFYHYKGCLMEFISKQLNDPKPKKCGKCMNCKKEIPSIEVEEDNLVKAKNFLLHPYTINSDINKIKPRKKVNNHELDYINEPGFFLSKYNVGLGTLVSDGKYKKGFFSDELVEQMVIMINYLISESKIKSPDIIAYIPSLRRPYLVRDFAYKVAHKLNIPCCDVLKKSINSPEQKTMHNSCLQRANVEKSFTLNESEIDKIKEKNVILIDDMVDSGWTFTVCGYFMMSYGQARSVTPFALADTSNGDS